MILLAALGFDNDEIAARLDTRRYVFTGGANLQALVLLRCPAGVCDDAERSSQATYPLGTAAGPRLGAGTLCSQAVRACCRYLNASRP